MKTSLTLIGTIALTCFAVTGCGDNSSTGNAPTNSEDQRRVTKDCDTQWRERVASAPVGQLKSHDITETTTGAGDMDGTIVSRSREELVSATDEAIVTKTRWEYFKPKYDPMDGENRLTKENFMLICSPEDAGEPVADPDGLARAGITIAIDRPENITVKAGTFAARYQKIHVDSNDALNNEVFGDHWTMNDETVVVKETIRVVSVTDGVTSERVTNRELIEFKAGR